MTEYDYSPEAYERHMAKLRSVEKWASRVAQEVPSNPFVPSDNGAGPAAPGGGAGNAYGYRDDRGGNGYGGRDGYGGGEGSSSRNITRSMSTPIDPRTQHGRRHSHSHQHQHQHALHHAQPMPMHPIPQPQPQPQPQPHPLAHLKSRSQTHPRSSRDAATSYSSTPTLVAQQYSQQHPQLQHTSTKHRSHSHSRSRSSSRAHSKHSRGQSYAVNAVTGVYGNGSGGVYSASYGNLQDGYRTTVPVVPAVPVQYANPTLPRIVTVQPGQTCYVNGRRIEYRSPDQTSPTRGPQVYTASPTQIYGTGAAQVYTLSPSREKKQPLLKRLFGGGGSGRSSSQQREAPPAVLVHGGRRRTTSLHY